MWPRICSWLALFFNTESLRRHVFHRRRFIKLHSWLVFRSSHATTFHVIFSAPIYVYRYIRVGIQCSRAMVGLAKNLSLGKLTEGSSKIRKKVGYSRRIDKMKIFFTFAYGKEHTKYTKRWHLTNSKKKKKLANSIPIEDELLQVHLMAYLLSQRWAMYLKAFDGKIQARYFSATETLWAFVRQIGSLFSLLECVQSLFRDILNKCAHFFINYHFFIGKRKRWRKHAAKFQIKYFSIFNHIQIFKASLCYLTKVLIYIKLINCSLIKKIYYIRNTRYWFDNNFDTLLSINISLRHK